ncbi:sensory neuron membrane protein 2-like [Thrips palmi]|uniref:Sensory neuron membrane protein 2 n=1 Tax=Thrips palmi TaxID=161013 RepID=A0A6P9ADT5_THRPL|nr:sensory neuron membrane protein 2-like [Thrips palmi]
MRFSARGWCWTGVAGVLLVVLAALLGWVAFPYFVHLLIGKELALKDGSDAYDRWVTLPIDLDLKLSIFNVTNKEEIMRGAKPKLQELGPYVYKQHRHKVNIKYDEEADTWTYRQILIHTFDAEQSAPFKEDDVVTTIHPALMSMINIMTNIPVLAKGTMFVDAAAPLLFPDGIFLTTTAGALLFGGVHIACGKLGSGSDADSPAFSMAAQNPIANLAAGKWQRNANAPSLKPRLAALITCSSFKHIKVPTMNVLDNGDVSFSLFGYKNNTADGEYTVKSGITQPEEIAQITAWNGKATTTAWGGPTCNAVNGTQGDIFSPYIEKTSTISVFSTDICRSMTLKYLEDASYRGIPGYRFAPGSEVMASAADNGNNYCFCPQVARGLTKENGCLKKGALDLSGCQGIPIIVTYPHFYESDPSYLDGVEGLNPQAELHRMQLDIEPMTGTPLHGGKKMQLNWMVRQVEGFELTKGVRPTLFPVAWMYEGAALNTPMVDLLNGLLFSKLTILDAVKYTLLSLGLLLFLVGAVMYYRVRRSPSAVRPQSPEAPQRPSDRATSAAGDVGLMAPGPHAAPNGAVGDMAETKLQAGVNGSANGNA